MNCRRSNGLFWDGVTARLSAIAALACVAVLATNCDRMSPPGERAPTPKPSATIQTTLDAGPATSAVPSASSAKESKDATSPDAGLEAAVEHHGPWLTVLVPGAGIYASAKADKDAKLGYAQSGARLAIKDKPKPGDGCQAGWAELVAGGFICANAGTLDEKDQRAKSTLHPPNVDALLPYTYARNTKNGTPMYKSVPSREEMRKYEPYLSDEKAKEAREQKPTITPPEANPPLASASASSQPVPSTQAIASSAPVPSSTAPPEDDNTPWWQKDNAQDKLHEMKLSDLRSDSDDVLAQRMVKGFYVAVDRTFRWSGRTWYKTTKRMVVPADRFGIAGPSDFKGVELGSEWQLPIAWVYGGLESAATYEIDADRKRVKQSGKVDHLQPIQLTDESADIKGTTYLALKDGKWVKKSQVRVTTPGSPPEGLKDGESWIDVNLNQQTLIVFDGTKPIFATLVSSGKSSKVKDKDHSTPTGTWRIREKHITTTMDGDGTAAGDLPYSIEDVPYVMYFFRSYAVHGAFWHRNYGAQMSHGCVNLSPLDAKKVFFMTEPRLPEGWHGIWASSARPGSLVVVHE